MKKTKKKTEPPFSFTNKTFGHVQQKLLDLLVCSTCIIFFHIISWKGPEKSVNSVGQLTDSKDGKGLQWMTLWKKKMYKKNKNLKNFIFRTDFVFTDSKFCFFNSRIVIKLTFIFLQISNSCLNYDSQSFGTLHQNNKTPTRYLLVIGLSKALHKENQSIFWLQVRSQTFGSHYRGRFDKKYQHHQCPNIFRLCR